MGDFTSKTPRHDSVGVIRRINELAELFRNSGYPVIHVQHDGTGTGVFEKYTTEWQILDELNVLEDDT